MEADYEYKGFCRYVTWLSFNKDRNPNTIGQQLDQYFLNYTNSIYQRSTSVSNDSSSIVKNWHLKHFSLHVQIGGKQKTTGCDKKRIDQDESGIFGVLLHKN